MSSLPLTQARDAPATPPPRRAPGGSSCPRGEPPSSRAHRRRREYWLSDATRRTLAFFGASGCGKSRTLGQIIAWQDFYRGRPVVLFDPKGETIHYFLGKLATLAVPDEEKRALWQRVRYVDLNGQDGFVTPFPIYPAGSIRERFSETSYRFIDVATRADPELQKAPILGKNAFTEVGTAAGIVLTALGLGITEAWSLLTQPQEWAAKLALVEAAYPETRQAVSQIRTIHQYTQRDQQMGLASLQAKLGLFRYFPNFAAIFGASTPGINWQTVTAQGQAVLLDFSQVGTAEAKKFCYLWVYESFLNFVKKRGYGQHTPVSLIIDEVSDLVDTAGVNKDILSGQLGELISILARSHQLWVTIAGQELAQLPEKLLQTVLTASALLFGQTRDQDMAKYLASRFFPYDPYLVKKVEPVQGVIRDAVPGGFMQPPLPAIHGTTHHRTTEFTIEEQINQNSKVFLNLKRFHFLAGLAQQEGELPTTLAPVTIAPMDAGLFVDKEKTTRLRAKLTARDAVSEEAVHREISERRDRCVCLARPAFHDIVHQPEAYHPREAHHPHATGASRRQAAHPAGPGQTPRQKTVPRPVPGSASQRQAHPEPAGAGRSPHPATPPAEAASPQHTGQAGPGTGETPLRNRFSRP